MNARLACLTALTITAGTRLVAAQPTADLFDRRQPVAGAVYTMTNAADGNRILIFERLHDGKLRFADAVRTGGAGTGTGLGNQGGVTLSRNERWLLAVNAGSNTITVFQVSRHGLKLVEHQASGGPRPISVTEHRGLVYVLNHGNDTITGFRLRPGGRLTPILDSTRSLSASGTDPAQIGFTRDGETLVVTEKATNMISTFDVDRDGRPGDIRVHPSSGPTPFGFAAGRRDHLFVSEAFGGATDASALSSYDIDRHGRLAVISGSVGTNQTAACWVALTPNGRYAYVTNTGSGSVSGFAIDFDGAIAPLDEDGRTGATGDGSMPIDLAVTDDGDVLYTLNGGNATIGVFRIRRDGSLRPLPFVSGLPSGLNGLAVR
jgi:6-phosphogluconolactonase (cycloisomerase 2 family)